MFTVFRAGMQKSRVPGRGGDSILYGGSSVLNLLQVTLLVLRILRRLLDFWKICALPIYIIHRRSLTCEYELAALVKGRVTGGTRSCRRETCPSVACPTQIPYGLPWDRTRPRDKKQATNRLSCGTTYCVSLRVKLSRTEPQQHNSDVTKK